MPIKYIQTDTKPRKEREIEFYILSDVEGQPSHMFERRGWAVAGSIETIAEEIPVSLLSRTLCLETKRQRFVRQIREWIGKNHLRISTDAERGDQQTISFVGDYNDAEKRVQRFTRGLSLLMQKYGLYGEYSVMGKTDYDALPARQRILSDEEFAEMVCSFSEED